LSRARALPKSVQVSEMLIREIASGRIVDGARLPTEREMASDLGIAVGTLRKALAILEDKGLLDRIQGSGNYVRAKQDVESVYTFFRLELLEGGGLPTANALEVLRLRKPEEAEELPNEFAHRIRRLRFLNHVPVALEEIWLDDGFASSLKASDLLDSLYYYYKNSLGLVISQIEDRVGVSSVPDWSPAEYGLKPGQASGFIERLSYDQNGRPAEFSKTWFNQNVARYTIRLK